MRIRWRLVFALAGAAFLIESETAHAQLYTPDPYDPAGRPFRAYAYPGAGEVYGGMSGTPRSRGSYNGPNQLDRADDDLGFPSGGLGGRYDSAFRQLDREYGRQYVPNEAADRKYFEAREKRERDLMRATLERDPKKRDRLVREAEQDAKKGAGAVGLSVRRGTTGSAVPSAPSRRTTSARPSSGSPRGISSDVPAAPSRSGRSGTSIKAPDRRRDSAAESGTTIPPAPSTRRASGADSRKPDPRPTDVLERSRNMDRQRSQNMSPRRLPSTP